MSKLRPGERKTSAKAQGVEADTVLAEAARLAAREKRDIPVRDSADRSSACCASRTCSRHWRGEVSMRKADPGKLSTHFSWLMALVLAMAAAWWLLAPALPEWFTSFPAPPGLDNAAALAIDNAVTWMKQKWVGFFDVFTLILRTI